MVLASRAVKERPDSLTARALIERARRELTRGRRREKLEAKRRRGASGCSTAGDFAAAEKIVTSALKFVPDHAVALAALRPAQGPAARRPRRRPRRTASSTRWPGPRREKAARRGARGPRGRLGSTARSSPAPRPAPGARSPRAARPAARDPGRRGGARLRSARRRRALHAQVRAGLELLGSGRPRGRPADPARRARGGSRQRAGPGRGAGGAARLSARKPASRHGSGKPAAKLAAAVPVETPLPVPAPAAPLAAARADRPRFRSDRAPRRRRRRPLPALRARRDPAAAHAPASHADRLHPRSAPPCCSARCCSFPVAAGRRLALPCPTRPKPRRASPQRHRRRRGQAAPQPARCASVDPELRQAIEATLAAYARALESGQARGPCGSATRPLRRRASAAPAPRSSARSTPPPTSASWTCRSSGNVARVSILCYRRDHRQPGRAAGPGGGDAALRQAPGAGWTLEAAAGPR